MLRPDAHFSICHSKTCAWLQLFSQSNSTGMPLTMRGDDKLHSTENWQLQKMMLKGEAIFCLIQLLPIPLHVMLPSFRGRSAKAMRQPKGLPVSVLVTSNAISCNSSSACGCCPLAPH